MYKLNWQNKGDEYKLEDFTRREYATYLVAKDVEISPLKITTHFDKMDYMPVYPVYSWVPVKNADHYKIDVFYHTHWACHLGQSRLIAFHVFFLFAS